MMFFTRWRARMSRDAAAHPSHSRVALSLVSLLSLLAICACGFTLHGGMGAPPLPVTHLPAQQLRLAIQISDQFGDKPNMTGRIDVLAGAHLTPVTIPESASLTCNGSDIKPSPHGEIYFSCPRQPPGGSYRFTFTDEHGAATTVVVPVPTGTFAILSPRSGSAVPIPAHGELTIRYAVPIPPANGSVDIGLISAWCRISTAEPCGAVAVNLHPYVFGTPTPFGSVVATPTEYRGLPTTTPNGLVAPAHTDSSGPATPTPGELATPKPGNTPAPTPGGTSTGGTSTGGTSTGGTSTGGYPTPNPGDTPTPTPGNDVGTPATAVVIQDGGLGTILLRGDYSTFQPGKKGGISMDIQVGIAPDHGAFIAASAVFDASVSTPVTWTR